MGQRSKGLKWEPARRHNQKKKKVQDQHLKPAERGREFGGPKNFLRLESSAHPGRERTWKEDNIRLDRPGKTKVYGGKSESQSQPHAGPWERNQKGRKVGLRERGTAGEREELHGTKQRLQRNILGGPILAKEGGGLASSKRKEIKSGETESQENGQLKNPIQKKRKSQRGAPPGDEQKKKERGKKNNAQKRVNVLRKTRRPT